MREKYFPTSQWDKKQLEEIDIDFEKIKLAMDEVKKLENINSFLLIKDGYLIIEDYYNGCNKDTLNIINSVTKSIISSLIGIVIDKGFIKGINERIIDYFPRHNIDESLTIRHLLTMTAGFEWGSHNINEPLLENMYESNNWIEFILNVPIDKEKIGVFQYNSGVSHILSNIITIASGMKTEEFANKYLFREIGIDEINTVNKINKTYSLRSIQWTNKEQWSKDPQGINIGGFGLMLKSRDMARLGLLYLNDGKWKDKQVISQDWIKESTKSQVKVDGIGNYGYHWWTKERKDSNLFFALGYGGHYIMCDPNNELVVVFTCESNNIKENKDPGYIIYKYIIPAFKRRSITASNKN
ncbi:beta-lactamase class C and other penicillin binding protein [Gottschalkia purinilytica]|uniref:Beta-lactamase class C and other penicillin binding protein n=1 Tax=Gottschalkia purinilytica TaxID=1503 RepID=A0A0L0WEV9_GOTPU|nr:serine hydrolase [Gottschalkia purinilytica]KNF10023.1 beta-lactamase class C and other penicillin binding protein [Gottschalkia purinilytica]